ncbi:hypothetical protein MIMGU_mgv1a002834mg [Erythranthe guttata]|uniref:Macro domain-containing protein n=1 Tax=Erythranthe guttata TaxID=4155 RepID=A0A022RPI1_ERYGU|nr:hypothetical protein MIMGU_mgv1a002834mg [Erythranthe guttata]
MESMEIDRGKAPSTEEEKKEGKAIVLVLVGLPGSGKSTFCDEVVKVYRRRPWVRVCQDTINKGKAGTKIQCLSAATNALKEGKNVIIDRCNINREQRADFLKLGSAQTEIHAVVLNLPTKLCISRSVERTEHEGNLYGVKAAAVVNQMLPKKELPKLSEGFNRITFCENETDVKEAIYLYASLGPLDSLPSGRFGHNKTDTTIQLGIMKFLKKKASDIIVEKVEEFVSRIGRARLILVDLSRESKILSLVKAKAAHRNIGRNKFFTFVGDITQLHSQGGLYCNVIANAANWRLKPGGGGVNAAIFKAAGPELEMATNESADCLRPGKSVVVPLPSSSSLFAKEGVTHVIHVLGPNMNPQRPDCLKDDYVQGSKILREAYSSLFEGFVSILESQGIVTPAKDDQKAKREGAHVSDSNKKQKGSEQSLKHGVKHWATWFQALYNVAMDPAKDENIVLEKTDDVVVINDAFPKAQKHFLVIARLDGLDSLADVCKEHVTLLKTMHDVGLKWVEKSLDENKSLTFRLGYHSVPSMKQLHLHVISQDFDSNHLKHKKHWNSFNTRFFLDSVNVIKELEDTGSVTLITDDFRSMELRCNRCRSAHPNLPRLKSHVRSCKAPFPADLLQNGRLFTSEGNA